ncbi:MAG: hypothetical protein AAFQ94_10985 [Bacteroidota bacterium]
MKKIKIQAILIALLMTGMFACMQEEEVGPTEMLEVSESKVHPGDDGSGEILSRCGPLASTSTNTIWADIPYQSSVSMNIADTKTFQTNFVCDATEYYWTVDDQATLTTTGPTANLQGMYLIWYPPGGCKDFNKKWTSSNPLFSGTTDHKEEVCFWLKTYGSLPVGIYEAKLKVQANNSPTYAEISVYVSDVRYCIDSSYDCSGDKLPQINQDLASGAGAGGNDNGPGSGSGNNAPGDDEG